VLKLIFFLPRQMRQLSLQDEHRLKFDSRLGDAQRLPQRVNLALLES